VSSERLTSGIVGDVARTKDETSRLPMEIGDFLLQSKVSGTVASDVPGTSGTSTIRRHILSAQRRHIRALPEIIRVYKTYFIVSKTMGLPPIPR
jgi:hypothetical protein